MTNWVIGLFICSCKMLTFETIPFQKDHLQPTLVLTYGVECVDQAETQRKEGDVIKHILGVVVDPRAQYTVLQHPWASNFQSSSAIHWTNFSNSPCWCGPGIHSWSAWTLGSRTPLGLGSWHTFIHSRSAAAGGSRRHLRPSPEFSTFPLCHRVSSTLSAVQHGLSLWIHQFLLLPTTVGHCGPCKGSHFCFHTLILDPSLY